MPISGRSGWWDNIVEQYLSPTPSLPLQCPHTHHTIPPTIPCPSPDNSLRDNISLLVIISSECLGGIVGELHLQQLDLGGDLGLWVTIKNWNQGWRIERITVVASSHLQFHRTEEAMGTKAAVACHNSISVSLSTSTLQPPLMSTFCPTYCDAQIYWKMVGLLCLPLCKSFFSQQSTVNKIPPMIWHTDRDDEDVDVNMVEGHWIGTAGGRWAEP